MFGRAKRFNEEVIGCGPPPTAYDPKHPITAQASSFPKGERFRSQQSNELDATVQLTRSHSSSSFGSTESGISFKSQNGKKDHSQCNKQIADLEKELRMITRERNELLRRKTLKSHKKENLLEAENVAAEIPGEILQLNKTIEELQSKLSAANAIEEDKKQLELERNHALADLDIKQEEILRITTQIKGIKEDFKKEEEKLKTKLEDVLNDASLVKMQMEAQISELNVQVAKLENVEAEMAQELAAKIGLHEKDLVNKQLEHEQELETVRSEFGQKITALENNLQQLVAEHDAESEQIKFEYSRQIDELNQTHDATVAQLVKEHAEKIAEIQSAHQEEIEQIQTAQAELQAEKNQLLRKNEEMTVNLETKYDEIATLNTQLEVARNKLESDRTQSEERYNQLKNALESEIVDCRSTLEKEAHVKEEMLRASFEQEKSALVQRNSQLVEMVQEERAKFEHIEQTLTATHQDYEERIQRLNENNQTEKEILIWQMNQQRENLEQEFKASYDRRLSEAEREFQDASAAWETKMNKSTEEFQEQIATLVSIHNQQLSNYRELHEAALENLEREKSQIVSDYQQVEKKLLAKEEEIEKLEAQMKEQTSQLESELEILRESNNDLVGDLLRITQEKLQAEERMETEKIELQQQAEADKEAMVQSHEESLGSLKSNVVEKERMLSELEDQLFQTQEGFRQQLCEREAQLQETKQAFETEMKQLTLNKNEAIDNLHKSYEQVIMGIESKYSQEKDNLANDFEQERAALKNRSTKEMKILQDEFCLAFEDLDIKLKAEKEELRKLRESMQLRDKQTADEWIQRETALMDQFSVKASEEKAKFEEQLRTAEEDKKALSENIDKIQKERDAVLEDIAVLQVQTEAQLSALNEQYDEERAMLLEKLSEQMKEISAIHEQQLGEVNAQLADSNQTLNQLREVNAAINEETQATIVEYSRRMEQMEHDHEEALLNAIREAMEPVDSELTALRKDREEFLLLKKKYQELEAMIEPFREQLEMFEAEKKALLNQALFAESSMASLASKYTQLLGHQNSKQKIHHLDKLKQDIFNLRKELAEKNLSLEKEKKARMKAETKLKEITGQRKYDPSEAFKVPDNPPLAVSAKPTPAKAPSKPVVERKPLRSQPPKGSFFVSMAEVEAVQAELEQTQQRQFQERREKSTNFDAFVVDFGNPRRETFDVPQKLNVTRNMDQDNKENNGGFPHVDISGISISDEVALKTKMKSARNDNLTSTPLQRHVEK